MSDQSPLIVPLTVEALVVNDAFRTGTNTFMRTQMSYVVMHLCGNGQPDVTNNQNDTNFTLHSTDTVSGTNNIHAGDYYNGVYLKWRLPYAFTNGVQDSVSGTTIYPPAPNRWLIVRYSGPLNSRQATAWLVESDYLYPSTPTATNASQVPCQYVQPGADGLTPTQARIGRAVLLGTWSESGHNLNLTVMAPGNPAFAFYQPQCNNVFSFIDCLNSQPPETLSYAVFGWFSARANDPLSTATDSNFASILENLSWTLPPDTDPTLTANWSLLCGSVDGVQWQNSTVPPGGAPNGTPVSISVGNTSIEALTAMITAQAAEQGVFIDSELLEAFQLDLIDVLDQPDGAAIVAEKLQASFFQKYSGGYTWNIVDAPNATTQISDQELAYELDWLATLNQDQASLDDALRQLSALQTSLYQMWWKYTDWPQAFSSTTHIQGLNSQAQMKSQLDPTVAGSLAQQTKNQMTLVQQKSVLVPGGDTPDELDQAILAYAAQYNLPESRQLKREAAPNYYLTNNPVVLISGAGASGIVDNDESALCRFPSQLVTGFKFNGQTISARTSGLSIPQPNLSGVTGVPWSTALLNSLVQEFFFLDPNNATIVSAAIPGSSVSAVQQAMSDSANEVGIYPTGAIQTWTKNPWHPLLLMWQATYYPIDYGTAQSPNWSFYNGQYFWNGAPASVGPSTSFQGLIQLSPTAALNMEARIQAFLANNPNLDPQEAQEFEDLLNFVQTTDEWDLLSQALDGFNNQLQLGLPGVFLGVDSTSLITNPTLPTLIGDAAEYPPSLGTIPTNPPDTASAFQPWRAGQFEFVNLILVDEWGQALWPIDSHNYMHETVYTPDDLTPVLTSPSVPLTVATGPVIGSISPSLAPAGGQQFTLTVNGVGFTSTSSMHWNGTVLTTAFVSPTQLTSVIPASLIGAAGKANITVVSGGVTSNSVPFTIAKGPTIASLNPNLLQAGMVPAAQFQLMVSGVGFGSDAIVQWNDTALVTAFISSTTLQATVPANFAFAPDTIAITVVSGGAKSNVAEFTLSAGAAITSLSTNLVPAGSGAFTLTVEGVGFDPKSVVNWKTAAGTTAVLATTFISPNQLTAAVTAQQIATAGTFAIFESVGARVLPNTSDPLIQLPPALLQPSRLAFDLVSATNDSVEFGPLNPDADPICGWVLPNHIDQSLMAYDSSGTALGEMSVGMSSTDQQTICWEAAPNSGYISLQEIDQAIPHFGPFLLALSQKTPDTFNAFLRAIDETLWTTVPMGATFNQSMAVLIGRPLAMVRGRLQFLLDGPPDSDPSWQFTFAPQTPAITSYEFAIELGNVAQLDDGLIGYFVADQYDTFNVVTESGADEGSYLNPIGENNNFVYLPFDQTTSMYVSMLVDPRADVHATTGILPVTSVSLPPDFTNDALAAMNVTFRVDGILTDQKIPAGDEATVVPTILMPVPQESSSGQWSWVENDEGTWNNYPTAPNDTSAHLSNAPPVLRRGLLQLSTVLSSTPQSTSSMLQTMPTMPLSFRRKK